MRCSNWDGWLDVEFIGLIAWNFERLNCGSAAERGRDYRDWRFSGKGVLSAGTPQSDLSLYGRAVTRIERCWP
jgi:hypothetical protein